MKRLATALLVMTMVAYAAPKAQEQDRLLKAAMNTELVDGNLKAAIEQYQKVVDGGNRALAAQALVRMAECYQKLGDAESRKIYERLVREYADQSEPAAVARARLGRPEGAATLSTMASRQMFSLPPFSDLRTSSMSADGRLVSYIDYALGGRITVHELGSGKEWILDNGTASGEADTSAISRDGKQVAYSWCCEARVGYELRVASLERTGLAPSKRLYANKDVEWIQPFDWSPDGNWVAVQLRRADRSGQMGLISARDGSLRVLTSAEWRGARQLFFSPDGRYLGFDLPADDASEQRDVFILAVDGSRQTPAVVGASDDTMMGWSPDGGHLLFASDRNGALGLWGVAVVDGRPQGAPQLIKPDVSWRSLGVTTAGSLYFGVHLGGRDIQVATADFEAGTLVSRPTNPIQSFLGFNDSPDWSPDGKYLAFLSRRDPMGLKRVVGIRSVETGFLRELRPKQLNYFQMPRWAPDGRSVVLDGRDLKDRAGTFQVDAQSGDATQVIASATGRLGMRPQLSPDGRKLYSRANGADGHVFIAESDVASGNVREIIRRENLGPPSLSPDGRFIAAIYHDGASKSSILLLITVSGGEARELLRASQTAPGALMPLDQRYIAWMPDSRAVLVSKPVKAEQGELWLVPTVRGEPRKIDLGTLVWGGFGFDVHPDGRQIAFVAGENKSEVWVLENFLPALSSKRNRETTAEKK